MIIFQNESGSHICGGVDDILKAQGLDLSYGKCIMTDESGSVTGVSGGSMSMAYSVPLIKSLRERETLKIMKAQQPARKILTSPKAVAKQRLPHKTFSSNAFSERLAGLQREMPLIKSMAG